jgi:hypothetical protein
MPPARLARAATRSYRHRAERGSAVGDAGDGADELIQ